MSPEGQSKIKQAFIEKYHPCEHGEEQAEVLTPASKELAIIEDYEKAEKDDEAEAMYKDYLVKYPTSSEATILLMKLYLKNNKLNLAEPLITQGHTKFPQSITLQIYTERLPKLQVARSLEQKKQLMDDIASDESIISTIRLECYLKKNK